MEVKNEGVENNSNENKIKIRKWATDVDKLDKAKLTSNINYVEHHFDNITYTFRYYANKIAPTNKEQMTMLWYVFLSQFFKDDIVINLGSNQISTRLSSLILQPSRTGKNYSTDIIYDISKYANTIITEKLTSFTENAIIGQVINKNVDYNDKKGHNWNDIEELRDKDAKKPFREGIMETTDIIIIEEGKGLFIGGYKENLTRYLQEMTDEKGEVNIGRGSGHFKRKTSCSLMITSVPFDSNVVEKIIDDGFFQRFMLFYKLFSNEEINNFEIVKQKKIMINTTDFEDFKESYIENGKLTKDDILQFKLSWEENEAYKKLIARELKNVKDKLKKNKDKKTIIQFGIKSSEYMNNEITTIIEEERKDMFGDNFEKILSFRNIIEMITTKVAGINAYLNERDIINESDIKIGIKFSKIHLESIIRLLSSLESKNNKENIYLSKFIGNTWKTKDRVIRTILSLRKQTNENAKFKLDELIRKNYLESIEDERTGEMKYKCRDDIYELALSDDDFSNLMKEKSKAIKIYNNEPLIQLLINFLKYLEDKEFIVDINVLKSFCEVFYPNKSKNEPYNLENKLRDTLVLPKDKRKWYLYEVISEHIYEKQFSVIEEELFQYLERYIEYLNRRDVLIKEYKKDWENKKQIKNLDQMNNNLQQDFEKTKEKAKNMCNEKIAIVHKELMIWNIPKILKKHLIEESTLHLEKSLLIEDFL